MNGTSVGLTLAQSSRWFYATSEVKRLLARYPGVSDIKDDLPYGKEDLILELTPHGKALGFTTESVARQVRNAFEGSIAQRFPRGDEEVTVRVQFARANLGIEVLDDFYLRSQYGSEVALSEVVSIENRQGFSKLKREDGKRQVAIIAELAETAESQKIKPNPALSKTKNKQAKRRLFIFTGLRKVT